jgi:hypothetical protein
VRCKVVAHIKSDATDKGLAVIRDAERLSIDLSYYKVTHFDPSALVACSVCKGAGGTARGRPAYVPTIPHMLSGCFVGAR